MTTSTSGQLQIDTKTVNANPFGLYICQLNASGVTFNKTIFIKEQGNHIVYTKVLYYSLVYIPSVSCDSNTSL